MAFKLKRSSREPMSEINVTPFVDVMLVLLIIFMVTAPLLTVGVQVDLPESSADSLPEEQEPLTLTINAKGEIFIQESKVDYEKIVAKIFYEIVNDNIKNNNNGKNNINKFSSSAYNVQELLMDKIRDEKIELSNKDHSDQNLVGKNFFADHIKDTDFSNANLVGADFSFAKLDNVNFPKGLSFEIKNIDNKLVFNFQSIGDTKKLVATVDEVLEHVKLVSEIIE